MKFKTLPLFAVMFAAVLCVSFAGASSISEAEKHLASDGLYYPRLYWNADGFDGAGGLYVVEPVTLEVGRELIRTFGDRIDTLETRDRITLRRFMLARASFEATIRGARFQKAITSLQGEIRQRLRSADLLGTEEANLFLAEKLTEPSSRERYSSHELLQQMEVVADITCYDNAYTPELLPGGIRSCKKGGSGCFVQIPCPGGGNTVLEPIMQLHGFLDDLGSDGKHRLRVELGTMSQMDGGLTVLEPAIVTRARKYLATNPDDSRTASLRAANLIDRMKLQTDSLGRGPLAAGLGRLKQTVASGFLSPSEVLEREPEIASLLTISETAPLFTQEQQLMHPVSADITCYDTGYHGATDAGPPRCLKGGSGCWVEIPCPMGGGFSVIQQLVP